jgi:plasmid stabilization system protein ParE
VKVIILAPAQMELERARDYYQSRANARVAEAFLNQFEHAVRLLIEFPLMGTELSKRLRFLPLRNFPYTVIYQIGPDRLIINAVAHQRRRPGYWAKRR